MKKLLILLLFIFHVVIINSQNQTNNTSLNNTTIKNQTTNNNTKPQTQTKTDNQNKEQNKKPNQQNNQNQANQKNLNNTLNQPQSNKTTQNDTKKENDSYLNLTQALKDFATKLIDSLSNKTKEENEKELKEKKRKEEIKKNAEQIRMKQREIEMNRTRNEIKLQREECEKQLSNKVFKEILSLSVPAKNGEMLYQNITNHSKLLFAFYISDEHKQMHLTFSGPNDKGRTTLIKSFRKKNCLFYEHDVTRYGEYSFFFNNYQNSEDTEVIFLLHVTNVKSDNLGAEKVDKISGYLQEIDQNMNNMRMTQGIINKKTNAHNESVNKHNKQIVVYSVVEVVVLILVFAAQSYYVKRLVSRL